MKLSACFCLLFCSFVSLKSFAQTSIKWGTDYWQGYTDYDGSGFYNELMHQIFPEPEYVLDIHYYPWKRAVKNVLQGNIDMTGAMHKTERLYHSKQPVLIDRVVMVSRVEDALTQSALNDKLGAYRSGYEDMVYYPYLEKAKMGLEVEDSYKGLTLLAMKKIDFYVGADSLVQLALNERDDRSEYEVSEIGSFELYWSFAFTDHGLALKTTFDEQLEVLREQGVLAQLYYKYGLTMPF
ncbi:substrate-binding periplasmic protein [Alteromonas portus]|nr:transporter substrate-binding domain-containing protein [Alteromonas portus]